MERDLEDLFKEAKEFLQLNRQNKQSSFPKAGTACYLVSKKWIRKYKEYILYKDLKINRKPTLKDDHCSKTYPGEVSNAEDLLD